MTSLLRLLLIDVLSISPDAPRKVPVPPVMAM
jgi:hypothetical protein